MKAIILAVGDEVLLGDVVNSNAAYLSQQLNTAGVHVEYHKTIGDDGGVVKETFLEAASKADIIVTIGGLGPTLDDLTKKSIADAMGLEMVFDETAKAHIAEIMSLANSTMTSNNETQCWVPKGSIILENRYGTAPGIYLEHNSKTVIMLPGPPRELIPMFEASALPRIQEKANKRFAEKYYMTSGIGESLLEYEIRKAIPADDPKYQINTYINAYGVMLKATAYGNSQSESNEIINNYDKSVKSVLGESLYSEKKQELWEIVAEMLISKGLTISCAESFTGGLFAETLCRKEGISAVFKGSIVAYSIEAKIKALGVNKNTIERFGAVSAETAKEMAQLSRELFSTDIALSFTGVAGPQQSEGKDPGICYIGLSCFGDVSAYERKFRGDRGAIQSRGVSNGFLSLYNALKNN